MSHILTNAAWELDIPDPVEKLVLLSLASHASNDGVCFPSVPRLSKRTGLSQRSVQRRLKSLIQHGWLKVEYKSGHSSNYTIKIPITPVTQSPLPLTNSHHTPVSQSPQGCPLVTTGGVTQSPIISKVESVSETVRGIGIPHVDKILMDKSLARINKRLDELKDADIEPYVTEKRTLKASKKLLLYKLGLPA